MSKVYSFRLNYKNPREAKAKKVIEDRIGEGLSLRYVIVEALLHYEKVELEQSELNSVVRKLQKLVMSIDYQPTRAQSETTLTKSFLDAVRQSFRSGMKVD